MRFIVMLSLLVTTGIAPAAVPATPDTTIAVRALPSMENTHKKPGVFKRMLIRGVEKRLQRQLMEGDNKAGYGWARAGFICSMLVLAGLLTLSLAGGLMALILCLPGLIFSVIGLRLMKKNHVKNRATRFFGGIGLGICGGAITVFLLLLLVYANE